MPALTLTGGRRLRYDEQGQGPLLVLLHGSPGTAKSWSRVGERLAERLRLVAPDLPGHGGSDAVPAAHRGIDQVAADVEALIGVVGDPLVLVGHSYGGAVALSVAARGRVRLGGLVLLEAVALPVLRSIGDAGAFAAAKAVFDDYIAAHESGAERVVGRMVDFWFGTGAFERMPGPLQDSLVKGTGQNVLDVQATLAAEYPLDALRKIDAPLLAVHGAASPAITAKIAAALASESRRGRLAVVDGATHALTATHAEEVARLIAAHADHCAGAR